MNEKQVSRKRKFIVTTIAILLAVVAAIILHANMPGEVNIEDFDSVFVNLLGFPVVALFYFVILFIHCAIVMVYYGGQSNMPKLQIGMRFGLVFASVYIVGMQEIVVEGSPFEEWGLAFVRYQFLTGLADAIPVLLLCIIVAYFTLGKRNAIIPQQRLKQEEKIIIIALISTTYFIVRAISYETGIIGNNCNIYPIQCYMWTVIFGITLGISYITLYPIYIENNKRVLSLKLVVLTIGLNWMIFNSFIGLIFSGVLAQMLLRSGLDILVFFLTSIVINVYIIKSNKSK